MDFTHINDQGRAKMVDVTVKDDTVRVARARAAISMQSETLQLIISGGIKKGDVLGVAQVAGIMGAKQTAHLIPMCHPLLITSVDICFELDESNNRVIIISEVKTTGKTGIEMEALIAASIAALTIYDMCKSVDRWMRIETVELIEKQGGKSGHVRRED
ncbi:MAG: cyclic pyranopterin monophosphate synthase MoaC [Syntrophomonadaceae bacterium]|nr:cyclic pyranopterin monophosphate synthase MoaC [Syntrophomonadaceae bacterium]